MSKTACIVQARVGSRRLPGGCAGRSWRAALAIIHREPQLALINEGRRQR